MNIPWRQLLIGELSWKRLGRSLLLIYGILLFIGCTASDNLLFPYPQASYTEAAPDLTFLKKDNGERLATRFWKAPNEKYLVLLFHGNAEDLGHLDPIVARLQSHHLSVLALDYPGYGLSEGTPSEKGCYQAGSLLYQNALQRGYTKEHIIFWGRSIGSGTATELALQHDGHALVLESAFATAFRVMTRVPLLPFDKFHNLKKIPHITERLFVIHGEDDTLIPPWHSEKLYNAHPGNKKRILIPNAGHNDLWLAPLDETLNQLEHFLAE